MQQIIVEVDEDILLGFKVAGFNWSLTNHKKTFKTVYLTIITQAWMGSESIAHEAEGRMDYWLRGHGGERIIVLVKPN